MLISPTTEVIDLEAGKVDAAGILNYLSHKGCFEASPATQKQESQKEEAPKDMVRYAVYLKDYKIMYSKTGGMVEYIAKLGTDIAKGQVMAKVLNIDELENSKAITNIQHF